MLGDLIALMIQRCISLLIIPSSPFRLYCILSTLSIDFPLSWYVCSTLATRKASSQSHDPSCVFRADLDLFVAFAEPPFGGEQRGHQWERSR